MIDVRALPQATRQPLALSALDGLSCGEGFEIVIGDDPHPLFEWCAVAQGPSRWQVRITRLARGADRMARWTGPRCTR